MQIKKILVKALSATLLFGGLVGVANAEKLKVVTSFSILESVAQEIGGDKVSTYSLIPRKSSAHSFAAKPQDLAKIKQADIFAISGLELEAGVDKILESTKFKKKFVVASTGVDGIKFEGGHHHHHHDHDDAGHDDHEKHSHTSTFADSDVRDRPLSDWAGDWKSAYPYIATGELDGAFRTRAETKKDKTAAGYKEYFTTGFKTDVERIVIDKNSLTFYKKGKATKAEYKYTGYKIYNYESGSKGARFNFEAVNNKNGAPKYIQFSDHIIKPGQGVEHFHLYFGNDLKTVTEELTNWPTYYPKNMSAKEIEKALGGHDHSKDKDDDHNSHKGHDDHHDHKHGDIDPHIWQSPVTGKIYAKNLYDAYVEVDPKNKAYYKANLDKFNKTMDGLDAKLKSALKSVPKAQRVIVTAHQAFNYLGRDYGIKTLGIQGIDNLEGVSARDIANMIKYIKKNNVKGIFFEADTDKRLINQIIKHTKVKVGGVLYAGTLTDVGGVADTYTKMLSYNIDLILKALK